MPNRLPIKIKNKIKNQVTEFDNFKLHITEREGGNKNYQLDRGARGPRLKSQDQAMWVNC